jgi:hypothetical protein
MVRRLFTGGRARRVATPLLAVAVFGALVAGPAAPPASPAAAQTAGLGSGGEYHPLTPARIYDTRYPALDSAPAGAKPVTTGAGSTFDVQLLGRGGIPTSAANVLAVVLNVTVADTSRSGYLSIWGKGASASTSSLINFSAGQNVPNVAIVRPGSNGQATIKLVSEQASNGAANVIVDVFGWISTSSYGTNGARLIPVGPGRIFDSRQPQFNGGQPLGTGAVVTIDGRGADSVSPPATDIVPNDASIVGLVLNVTSVNTAPGSTSTYVSVLPNAPGGPPSTSNLNVVGGQIKANLVIVPVGSDGKLRLFNEAGANHLIVDVMGVLRTGVSPSTRTGRIIPLESPFRAFDTRQGEFGAAPLPAGQAEDWSFRDFANSVTSAGAPIGNQSALLGNLTATGLKRVFPNVGVTSYLTVYPPPARPETSNLNIVEGASVPNMSLIRYGTSGSDPYTVRVFNFDGSLHYIVDVAAVVLAD